MLLIARNVATDEFNLFRFSKPVPAGPWAADRVRDGTRDPPVCLQPDAIKLYDDSQACMISMV